MLHFDIVPNWGWRAREGDRTFEIERLPTAKRKKGRPPFKAYIRRKGRREPIAALPFQNTVLARRWLERRAKS